MTNPDHMTRSFLQAIDARLGVMTTNAIRDYTRNMDAWLSGMVSLEYDGPLMRNLIDLYVPPLTVEGRSTFTRIRRLTRWESLRDWPRRVAVRVARRVLRRHAPWLLVEDYDDEDDRWI